jgi:hypothetical protein
MARKAQLADAALPVVYMTGAAADESAVQGVPGSVLLQEPFASAQLITAISQLLNVTSPPSSEAAAAAGSAALNGTKLEWKRLRSAMGDDECLTKRLAQGKKHGRARSSCLGPTCE